LTDNIAIIIVIIICIIFSAFFSGMEIAFLSSNKLKLELEKQRSGMYNYIARIFTGNPGQYISTILVGNNIALVVYSIFMSRLLQALTGSENYLLETIISTIIIVFAGEFIPKAVVRANPNFYLRTFSVTAYIFYLIFYPISRFASWLASGILRIFGLKVTNTGEIGTFDKIDLASLMQEVSSTDKEAPQENELKLFQNALDFSDIRVRDCMVPRVDIDAIDIEDSIEDLRKLFIKTRFSRIPVYRDSIDTIIGYVSSRQLFSNPGSIGEILLETIFVPESHTAQKLLAQFIKTHKSLAIVIDEFGGTAGMITIEDILEEIFGEIEDEHDDDYLVDKKVSDNEFIFSGRQTIEYLNEQYRLNLPESDNYDTLAGYILFASENLPQPGEIMTLANLQIKILRASSSKISLLQVKII